MNIGIAGPISLQPFKELFSHGEVIPRTYSFPLIGHLAREVYDRGHSVTVFALSSEVNSTVRLSTDRLQVIIMPQRARRTAYDFYSHERKILSEAMSGSDCDIIHAHWTYEFAAAGQSSGKPVLITAHDSPLVLPRFFLWTKGMLFWVMRSFLGLKVVAGASAMSAVSPYVQGHLQVVSRSDSDITVIPNGVGESLFQLGSRRLERWSPSQPLTLAMVLEGFTRRKNAKVALKAFQILRRKNPQIRMRCYGVGFGPGDDAERWAEKSGLLEGIEFVGKVSQERLFRELTEQTHLLVHPSLEEAHPMALCEAMALGVPILGGRNSGGVAYTLADGAAGYLCDVRSASAIAETVQQAIDDYQQSMEKARYAWEYAHREFTISRMTSRYLDAYERVLGRTTELP